MLDIEIIKWGCKFADGYSISYQEKWKSYIIKTPFTTGITFLDNWDREMFFKGDKSLFLQRVKQGINKNPIGMYRIDAIGINLFIINEMTNTPIDTHCSYYDNDGGLEEAIKYIFNHLTKHEI